MNTWIKVTLNKGKLIFSPIGIQGRSGIISHVRNRRLGWKLGSHTTTAYTSNHPLFQDFRSTILYSKQIELLNQAENVRTPVPAVDSSYLNHFHFSLFELMLQKYAYIHGVVLFVDINLHGGGGGVLNVHKVCGQMLKHDKTIKRINILFHWKYLRTGIIACLKTSSQKPVQNNKLWYIQNSKTSKFKISNNLRGNVWNRPWY